MSEGKRGASVRKPMRVGNRRPIRYKSRGRKEGVSGGGVLVMIINEEKVHDAAL